jgi:membrane-associated phospholipid phosphatase
VSRRAITALAGALACVAALFPLWALAFRSAAGERADAAWLHRFFDLRDHVTVVLAHGGAGLADPIPFMLLGAALTVVALARGHRRLALVVPIVLVGANTTTQILKPLLAEPRYAHFLGLRGQITPESWPSGHSTAALALALCALLVVPSARRGAAVVGGALFVAIVSVSILVLGWHYPSDVLGGYLVAGAWALGGVAALALASQPWVGRRLPVGARRYAESAPASGAER